MNSPRCLHRDRLPSQPESEAAKAMFWDALVDYPELKQRLIDIIETDSWEERSLRWGMKDAATAKLYAERTLGEHIEGLNGGAVIDLLLQATGR